MKERLDLLKKGTHLYKVRDKGVRGLQMYKRKYWLDMENLLIHFSPHKDPSTKLGCAAIAGELLFHLRNFTIFFPLLVNINFFLHNYLVLPNIDEIASLFSSRLFNG